MASLMILYLSLCFFMLVTFYPRVSHGKYIIGEITSTGENRISIKEYSTGTISSFEVPFSKMKGLSSGLSVELNENYGKVNFINILGMAMKTNPASNQKWTIIENG